MKHSPSADAGFGPAPVALPGEHKRAAPRRIARLVLLAIIALTITGCAHNYVITLINGNQIGTRSKPRLKNGEAYVYKDMQGNEASVPAGKVREIEPASMARKDKEPFNPAPVR